MAISSSTFMKRFTQAVAAIGLSAALASASMADTKTWVGTATGTAAGKWGTGTAVQQNWSPSGLTTGTTDTVFGSATNYTLSVIQNVNAQSMTFTNAAASDYTLNVTGSPTITLSNGTTGNVAIVNNSSNKVTINPTVTLSGTATTMKIGGTGSGAVTLAALNIGSKTLEVQNASSLTVTALASSGGNVTVTNGSTLIQAGSGSVGTFTVSGGSLSLGNPSLQSSFATSNLVVNGGTFVNNGYERTFNDVTISSGTVSLASTFDVLRVTGNYQQTGGEIGLAVASLGDYSQVVVSGSVSYAGGSMALDLTGLSTPTQPNSWQLFSKGSSQTSTSGLYNFSGFSSTSDNPDLASLGWTKDGQEWKSSPFSDGSGNFFVFTSQNGVLMVVPEPSTYAMGAIGLATAGFFRWRSRRRTAAIA